MKKCYFCCCSATNRRPQASLLHSLLLQDPQLPWRRRRRRQGTTTLPPKIPQARWLPTFRRKYESVERNRFRKFWIFLRKIDADGHENVQFVTTKSELEKYWGKISQIANKRRRAFLPSSAGRRSICPLGTSPDPPYLPAGRLSYATTNRVRLGNWWH